MCAILGKKNGGGRVGCLGLGGQTVFVLEIIHLFGMGCFNSALDSLFQSTELPFHEAEISFFVDFTADSAFPLL